jgi:hypothetical protein
MKNSAFPLTKAILRLALIAIAGLQTTGALASVDRIDYAYHCAGIGTSKGLNADVLVGANFHKVHTAQIKVGGKVLNGRALKPSEKRPGTSIVFQLPRSNSMKLDYQLLYGGRHLHSGQQGGYLALKTVVHGNQNATHNLFVCSRKPVIPAADDEYAWITKY